MSVEITNIPYLDLRVIVRYMDNLLVSQNIFSKQVGIRKTKLKKFPISYQRYSVDSIMINQDLKYMQNKKEFLNKFQSDVCFRDRFVVFNNTSLKNNKWPTYRRLEKVDYVSLLIMITMHELRHRYQQAHKPNIYLYVHDYCNDMEFYPFTRYIENVMDEFFKEKYHYSQYLTEFDSLIIEAIGSVEIYFGKLNNESLEQILERCAKVVIMNSNELRQIQLKFCPLF